MRSTCLAILLPLLAASIGPAQLEISVTYTDVTKQKRITTMEEVSWGDGVVVKGVPIESLGEPKTVPGAVVTVANPPEVLWCRSYTAGEIIKPGGGVFVVTKQGEHQLDFQGAALDDGRLIGIEQSIKIKIGQGPNPPPDPDDGDDDGNDDDGNDDDGDVPPDPDKGYDGPNDFGLGQLAFDKAPGYDAKVAEIFAQSAEYLFGRPELKVIAVEQGDPRFGSDFVIFEWIKKQMSPYREEWGEWETALMRASIDAARAQKIRTLNDWYGAFKEIQAGVEARK